MNGMKRRTLIQILKQAVCIAMVLVVLAPIVLTLFAAFKTKADMVNTSPLLLPPAARITMENFTKVLGDKYLLIGFKNTGIILVVSIFFNVMFGTITAFILERFQFRLKGVVMALFFLGMLIPSFVTEIARFKIINGLGLYNTLGAPIVIYVASDLMQLYMYIPYLYMPKNRLRTLTTFLMNFANAQQGSWQKLAAGIIVIMLPTILIYIFFQKYILAGVAAGAVKE